MRFHAVYWPAFLMAAGLPVPKRVTSQRLVDGRRREDEQVARQRHRAAPAGGDLRARPGALLPAAREAVRRRRHAVSHQALITRINVELANDLGNLAQRSLSLIARNCERQAAGAGGAATEDDGELLAAAEALPGAAARAAGPADLPRGAGGGLEGVRAANAYIDHQAPWALRRTDPARMAAVLRVLVDTLRVIATVLQPFMPEQHGADAGPARRAGGCAAAGRLWPRRWPTALRCRRRRGVFPRYVEPARARSSVDGSDADRFALPPRLLHRRRTCRTCWRARRRPGWARWSPSAPRWRSRERLPAMAEAHPNLWCTVGVHPHHAAEAPVPDTRGPRRDDRPSQGHRHRRVRPGLLLRPLAARRAAGRVSAPISAPRGWPACRSRSMPATPTTTSPLSCKMNGIAGATSSFLLHCFSSVAQRWRRRRRDRRLCQLLRHPDLPEIQ